MKRIGILAVILLLLAGGYALIQSYPKGDTFTPPSDVQLSEWNQESIDQLQFTFPGEQRINLTKEGSQWFVNTHKADQKRVEDLFTAFSAAEISSRVSTNKQNHERFEVGDKGVTLQLLQNGEVKQEVVLGKSAGGESIYFRTLNTDSVYVLNGLPQYLVSQEEAIWRNRELISLSPDQIRAIRYEAPRNVYKVELTESGWFAETDSGSITELDEQKTLSWLARFKSLQAIDFLELEEKPRQSLGAFTVEEGSLTSITQAFVYELFADEVENQVIVLDQEANYYVIDKGQIEDLLPSYNNLTKELTVQEESVE